MKKSYHILFGFEEDKIRYAIERKISAYGYEVKSSSKFSKKAILSYIEDHPDCDSVVLREVITEKDPYTAEELAELADMRDINVIVLLGAMHKGASYMQTLYVAGITSAIFISGKHGATAEDIARLIVEKRSRKEARQYYGIGEEKIDIGILSAADYKEYCSRLGDREYGDSLIDRFIYCVQKMNPTQTEDFIKRLPEHYLDELKCYDQFYTVNEALKNYKIKPPYKRPRNLKKAIESKSEDITVVNTTTTRKGESMGLNNFNSSSSLGNFSGNFKTEQTTETQVKVESTEKPQDEPKDDVSTDNIVEISEKRAEKQVEKFKSKKPIIIAGCVALMLALVACEGESSVSGQQIEYSQEDEEISEDIETNKKAAKKDKDVDVKEDNKEIVEIGNITDIDDVLSEESVEDNENDTSISNDLAESYLENAQENTTYKSNATVLNVNEEGIDKTTGLVISNDEYITDYTYLPKTTTTQWTKDKYYDGCVVTGLDAINIINGNPDIKFTIQNPYTYKVTTYYNGGASLQDIPAGQTYTMTVTNNTCAFVVK